MQRIGINAIDGARFAPPKPLQLTRADEALKEDAPALIHEADLNDICGLANPCGFYVEHCEVPEQCQARKGGRCLRPAMSRVALHKRARRACLGFSFGERCEHGGALVAVLNPKDCPSNLPQTYPRIAPRQVP